MDRRQQKTRKAIFNAFSNLLAKKKYSAITVQEIIDEADIGRTTFYAHFETKDMLLQTMCSDIFEHIFSEELPAQKETAKNSKTDFELILSHILFHLKYNEVDVRRILKSESEKEFIEYFKVHTESLFSNYVKCLEIKVPIDFFLNFLVNAFISTATWWIKTKSTLSPDETARHYMSVINI
ncbi:MAG: TetR/AcrR family transcriptional regulator [Spirochaetales bacterium]